MVTLCTWLDTSGLTDWLLPPTEALTLSVYCPAGAALPPAVLPFQVKWV